MKQRQAALDFSEDQGTYEAPPQHSKQGDELKTLFFFSLEMNFYFLFYTNFCYKKKYPYEKLSKAFWWNPAFNLLNRLFRNKTQRALHF